MTVHVPGDPLDTGSVASSGQIGSAMRTCRGMSAHLLAGSIPRPLSFPRDFATGMPESPPWKDRVYSIWTCL